jgi:hypothetical protein
MRMSEQDKWICDEAVITVRLMQETGGEGGIRTPGTLSGTPVFKTGAINHSATSPCAQY